MENPQRAFADFISAQGLKNTPQRNCIVQVFFQADTHLSTEELYDRVKEKDAKVGQATVYRTLKLLCEAGLAKEMYFGDTIARYEPNLDNSHHDHLICTQCGKNIEVLDQTIERLQEELAQKHNFTLTSHRMYLYGLCPDCSPKNKKTTAKKA